MTEPREHPVQRAPLEDRLRYASLVAAVAARDGETSPSEHKELEALCEALQLPPSSLPLLLQVTRSPDRSRHLRESIEGLAGSDLRFTLLVDMVGLAWADDRYTEPEQQEVRAMAARLRVDGAQLAAIEDTVRRVHAERHIDDLLEREDAARNSRFSDLAARLAAVGIPVAAVLASGSQAVALTAPFARVLGRIGGASGPLGGLGIMIALGVGSYAGIRALAGWLAEAAISTERS